MEPGVDKGPGLCDPSNSKRGYGIPSIESREGSAAAELRVINGARQT